MWNISMYSLCKVDSIEYKINFYSHHRTAPLEGSIKHRRILFHIGRESIKIQGVMINLPAFS